MQLKFDFLNITLQVFISSFCDLKLLVFLILSFLKMLNLDIKFFNSSQQTGFVLISILNLIELRSEFSLNFLEWMLFFSEFTLNNI
jgi:hypothetical protein